MSKKKGLKRKEFIENKLNNKEIQDHKNKFSNCFNKKSKTSGNSF
jgi:hypothetical protein